MPRSGLTVGYDGRPIVYRWTGMRTYTVCLIRHIVKVAEDLNIRIYYHYGQPDRAIPVHPRIEWRQVGAPTGWWWTFFQIGRVLRQEKVDLFHADYIVPPLASVPTVVTVHDAISALFIEPADFRTRLITNALTLLSVHRSRIVFVPSQSAHRDVVRCFKVPERKITVTPYGVGDEFRPGDRRQAIERLRTRFPVPDSFILTVNFFRPRKNAVLLASSFRELTKRKISIGGLVFVGGCPEEVKRKIIASAGESAERIAFTGYVDDRWLPDFYRACDVFVFPSLYEGFGLPVLEAMACGAPVVVSDADALKELVSDAGIIISVRSPSLLADALERVLTDRELKARLSEKSLCRAERFAWENTATTTWEGYQNAVRRL